MKRVAHLARIAIRDDEEKHMIEDLNAVIEGFSKQLDEVDVTGVEPLVSVTPLLLRMREDNVTDGNMASDIVANAPMTSENFFLVAKIIE
ncbi:Asp-tRNA(Asn)/Glu-tRNA(Gln) amidotransferase subunit GatC [Bartonella ancashensis]